MNLNILIFVIIFTVNVCFILKILNSDESDITKIHSPMRANKDSQFFFFFGYSIRLNHTVNSLRPMYMIWILVLLWII